MNIKTLKEALSTLKYSQEKFSQNTDHSVQNIFEDSCVKRFEYTIETAIKLMRKILKDEYVKEEADLTINNIFRLMDSYDFILGVIGKNITNKEIILHMNTISKNLTN